MSLFPFNINHAYTGNYGYQEYHYNQDYEYYNQEYHYNQYYNHDYEYYNQEYHYKQSNVDYIDDLKLELYNETDILIKEIYEYINEQN